MSVAIDTNILVHYVTAGDPTGATIAHRLARIANSHEDICVAPQVIYEFWVVATRPIEVNGLGLPTVEARRRIDLALRAFVVIPDVGDTLSRWLDLCSRYDIRGKRAHDARLVAWMLSHGITELLTLNGADFAAFGEIRAVTPA